MPALEVRERIGFELRIQLPQPLHGLDARCRGDRCAPRPPPRRLARRPSCAHRSAAQTPRLRRTAPRADTSRRRRGGKARAAPSIARASFAPAADRARSRRVAASKKPPCASACTLFGRSSSVRSMLSPECRVAIEELDARQRHVREEVVAVERQRFRRCCARGLQRLRRRRGRNQRRIRRRAASRARTTRSRRRVAAR